MKRRHPCYAGDHRFRKANLGQAKRWLSLGPWFWPTSDEVEALEVARRATGRSEPLGRKAHAPGRLPVVAYQPARGGSIWVVDLSVTESRDRHHEFVGDAVDCWRDAISAVPRSIPVLWKPLRKMMDRTLWAQRTGSFQGASVLDGRSFGLSFALALISKLLDAPVPATSMASADISETGQIRPVDGLEEKMKTIWKYVPGVDTVLVAQKQVEEASAVACGDLSVKGVSTLTEAVELVFDDLGERLISAGDDGPAREELVEAIFRLCMSRRDSVVDWGPVGRAARQAKNEWERLSEDEVQKLDIAEAVACRHQDNSGRIELPSKAWVDDLAQPLRVETVAHIVQQATDSGTPDEQATLEFGHQYLVDGVDAFGPHLKLMGALGRLHFVVGDLETSLAMQMEAVDEWLRRRRSAEVSYPLSYAYTVVGALGDRDAFEEVKSRQRRWRSISGATPRGDAYVRCYRGRAAALFGDLGCARTLLGEAAESSKSETPFARFVDRWRLYVLEETVAAGDGDDSAEELRAQIADRYGWAEEPDDHHTWWLAMTRAMRDENHGRTVECARRFIDAEEKIARRLVDHAGCSDDELPRLVLRRYPY